MKIAILDIDNLKNPHWGSGQARATYEISKRLSKKNTIEVYCSKYPGWKNYKENNVKYFHIGLGTNNPKINNIAYLLFLPFKVRSIKADVILENFTAPISTCFSPLFTKIPVIGISSFFSSGNMDQKYRINFSIIEKIGVKYYKYFIALNYDDEKKMKKLNSKINSIVIYNGVEDKYLKMKTREKNYILFIGRIDINQKGLDLLIKAFNKIKDKISDDLYIMGSGSDLIELKKLIERYKLQKRVRLLGKLSGVEKDKYLSESKIIVFPSRYEGQSIASLEALALGKPIICFDIPGFSWVDHEIILKTKKIDAIMLSENVLKLSENTVMRKNYFKKSKKFASNFTWEKTSNQYEKYLNRLFKEYI